MQQVPPPLTVTYSVLEDTLHGWLTEERLRLYPRAIFGALLVALVLPILAADGASTLGGALGGDYAAFHAVGTLVLDGRSDALYDWTAQAQAQAGLHPDEPGRFLAFAYPPFVVWPYAALASLGFVAGYAVHTAVALAALAGAVWLVAGQLPRIGRHPFAAFVLLFAFFPLLRSVSGGQNTQFSLLVLAGTWHLLARGRPVAAGAVAALLLAKPQLGIPLLGLVGLRHPRAGLGALGTAMMLYLLGAAVGGMDWPTWWWGQIGQFHTMDQSINAPNSVGVLGWLEALLGPGSPWATIPGWIASGGLVLAAMALWVDRRVPISTRFGVTSALLVLIPPHSMSYDAGLAGLGLLVWIASTPRGVGPALVWTAAMTAPLSALLGVSPLMPLVCIIAVAVFHQRP